MPFVRIRRKSLIQKEWDFELQTLGDHIRRRRLMLAITQEEAAQRLGVNAWTVHNWETGQRKPEIRFIPALVAFLGYDPEPVEEGTLAGRLIAKRRQLGLSQREAARSLQIDPGTWAGWERGERVTTKAHMRAVEGFLEPPAALQLAQGRGR
ncbi:MAG: helix-turn-helix domain-containing protein [Lysobacteraceae bacterium]|nr:MAG: helix-turn-helix domain-containing protein [Xanthomonadaceae bacterium]